MSTATEEVVDLDVNLDEPLPCSGIGWSQIGIPTQPCAREAEFKLTFRCCRPETKHKCAGHMVAYLNGYWCTDCNSTSYDLEVRPLR